MTWTNKYKKSIDCNNPKGFSQKAHCQARKLRQMGKKTESKPVNEAKNNMDEDFGIAKALSPIIHRKSYKMAKKTLGDVMKRKKESTKGPLYYAAQVAKSYPGVDAKKLASMHEDAPANVAGSGAIAGLGVGPQGEPGVNMKKKRKVIPFAMFVRKKPNQ
jgi:hypothetical protein